MKVSVVIAAYNSADFIVETLESVINQTIDDFEIIIVNDGSTDDTLEILNNYAVTYDKITVINQENSGPSAARNAGIDVANGEFLFFLDADDILEFDALENLYNTAVVRNADLVIAKYDIFNKFKIIPIKNLDKLVQNKKIDKYDTSILWTFSLWNKLFKKSIIDEFNLRLAPISYSEDGEFLMKYVYKTKKITGLDKVVLHYRKQTLGEVGSITSYLNESKVCDYIEAHNLILKSAENSFLNEYKNYNDIEEAKSNNPFIKEYLNEIIRKELQILLEQFYTKFWSVNKETIELIVGEINEKIKLLDMRSISKIKEVHSDLSLNHLYTDKDMMIKSACITAALFAESSQTEDFFECLNSLVLQSIPNIKIIVPEHFKEEILNRDLYQENILFSNFNTKDDFYKDCLENSSTDYIIFCNPKFIYYTNAFRTAYRYFIKNTPDFITNLIYHANFGELQPVTLNKIAFNQMKGGYKKSNYILCDMLLYNKFFNVKFLKTILKDYNGSIDDKLSEIYSYGYFVINDHGNVIFNDEDEKFIDYVSNSQNREIVADLLKDNQYSLESSYSKPRGVEALPKLYNIKNKNLKNILKNIVIKLNKNSKVKDRVLFFSIRTDGKLEGNSKAVFPYIKSKKTILAKKKFNIFDELLAFRRLMTSKVIVTDDYIRYLRHFTLKPEQRVVQIWHACGAFKKFGQRGTNIPIWMDKATHSQYSLVSVSSEYVRSIYADAFDIRLRNVSALGCPSTDEFLNDEAKESIKNKIYKRHPEFKDKSVIIYAPTFRDGPLGRSVFTPKIDFKELSKSLLPDQLFVICPHPLMKNDIIDKKYPNIKVVRDFSTDNLMFVSDMLITDYSSVIFQYSLLNKPMAFYCYDLESYSRDFYLNYPDDLPGDVFKTQEELVEFITNKDNFIVSDKHRTFFNKYMSACDGNSSRRIADLINSYIEANN